MKREILLTTKYFEKIDIAQHFDGELIEKYIKNISIMHQIKILEQLCLLKNVNIYLQLFPIYATDIGDIDLPWWYQGRLIFPEELASVLLEFKYYLNILEESSEAFILN